MKIKRILAIILITAIAYTGIASLVAWLVIRANKNDGQANAPAKAETVLTGNDDIEITDNEDSPIRMTRMKLTPKQYAAYGVSENALSAYTLTATITPEDLTNFVELEWTAEWYRPNVSWVEGEDVYDYIKITPNGHQAVIESLKGWDEAIIVKASLKDNPGVFASCRCAYISRYGKVNAMMEDGTGMTFEKDEQSHFSLEKTIYGKGQLIFTGMEDEVGTTIPSVFDLSMEINDVLAQKLQGAGFTVYSNKVVYGDPLYDPQLSLSKYGYETMLYLPGADADILGATQSNLIKQGYLWAIGQTDSDGSLFQEERDAYNRYREAVIAAWNESDDFMITLTVTQYDSKENMIVLRQYYTQMDFVATELLPELTVASVTLDYSTLEF